jgi:uncharacterized membrane protein YgcG
MEKTKRSIESLPHDAFPPSPYEEILVETLFGQVVQSADETSLKQNESRQTSSSLVVDVVAFVVSYWVFDLVLARMLVFMGAGPYLVSPLVVQTLRVVSALTLFLLLKHVRLSLS